MGLIIYSCIVAVAAFVMAIYIACQRFDDI